jgi:hypothetical protein
MKELITDSFIANFIKDMPWLLYTVNWIKTINIPLWGFWIIQCSAISMFTYIIYLGVSKKRKTINIQLSEDSPKASQELSTTKSVYKKPDKHEIPQEASVEQIVNGNQQAQPTRQGIISDYKNVIASRVYNNSNDYKAANVNNTKITEAGNEYNYWLLPDKTKGWIEIDLGGEYTIEKVKILNTKNGESEDRWTEEYTLELKDSSKSIVKTTKSRFPDHHVWKEHEFLKIHKVHYVRLNIDSFGTRGGGINEIDVYGS